MKRLIERQKRYVTEDIIQPVYGKNSFSYPESRDMNELTMCCKIQEFNIYQAQYSCKEISIEPDRRSNDIFKLIRQQKLWLIPRQAKSSPNKTSVLLRNHSMTRKSECSSPGREYNRKHVINANQLEYAYLAGKRYVILIQSREK